MLTVAFKLFIFGFLTFNLQYQDPQVLPQANANIDITLSYHPANAKVEFLLDYPPARVNFGITLGGVVRMGRAGPEGGGRGGGGELGAEERGIGGEREEGGEAGEGGERGI